MYERPIESAVPRTRRENAVSERQENAIDSTGKMNERKNESSDSFAGVHAQLSQVKERRSPLRLNVSGREKTAQRATGFQEHENRVQLSPGKGYLIGNESKVVSYI